MTTQLCIDASAVLAPSVRADATTLRALLISDTRVFQDALTAELNRSGRIEVVGAVTTSADAVHEVRASGAEVVLIQQALPAGLMIARILRRTHATVIAFGVGRSEREILAWAEAGVLGCVVHDATLGELLSIIESAAQGVPACSGSLASVLFRRVSSMAGTRPPSRDAERPLTRREAEILTLVKDGLSNKQIAETLLLQLPTVKNHIHNVLRKLGVRSRVEAISWFESSDQHVL